ncbi:MAG: hypothetical protein V3U03_05965 [Myxococcota bacterium]
MGRLDQSTAGLLAAVCLSACAGPAVDPEGWPGYAPLGGSEEWEQVSNEPILDRARPPAGLPAETARRAFVSWNDPSVMKEGALYSMWASLGLRSRGRGVSIYKLTSPDGVSWSLENGGQPVLSPGTRSRRDFDGYGVATPDVIKAGGVYHLYYTAHKDPHPRRGGILFTMGHATSPDGVHWTRRGELRSLTHVVGEREGNPWGWLARAEPAAVHHEGTFYLYFADVRCRQDDCAGFPRGVRGISLATSRDGQRFTQVGSEPILLQSEHYAPEFGWEGYSTPWVYHDGEHFQLYVDLFRVGGAGTFQTAIAHYRSSDGIHFEEMETDIVTTRGHPWAFTSVRAPSVVQDGDRLMMWYAGDSFDPVVHTGNDIASGRVRIGIGLATRAVEADR